MKGKIQELFTR